MSFCTFPFGIFQLVLHITVIHILPRSFYTLNLYCIVFALHVYYLFFYSCLLWYSTVIICVSCCFSTLISHFWINKVHLWLWLWLRSWHQSSNNCAIHTGLWRFGGGQRGHLPQIGIDASARLPQGTHEYKYSLPPPERECWSEWTMDLSKTGCTYSIL